MRMLMLLVLVSVILSGSSSLAPSTFIVHAGSSRTAFLPGAATLALSARVLQGDASGASSWAWSTESDSPGPVSFSTADRQSTNATFSAEGVYTVSVRVLAADGSTLTSSSLVVEVYDTTRGHDFGYNASILRRFFTGDAGLQFDPAALTAIRAVSAPPAVGVHPRVLFSPEDLPDIRTRLQNTAVGRTLWTAIHDRVVRQLTGGIDSKGKVYSEHNRTSKTGAGPDPEGILYDSLVAGNVSALMNATASLQSNVVGLIAYAGLILQVDASSLPSGTAGKACAALATVGDGAARAIEAALPASGCSRWQHYLCDYREQVQPLIYREFTGLAYDMLAPMMTTPQRESVRLALALATRVRTARALSPLSSQFSHDVTITSPGQTPDHSFRKT
jgi:PKD repeat protein